MNYQTTVVLLVSLLVVGAYFVFIETGIDTATEYSPGLASHDSSQDQALFDGDEEILVDAVTEITLHRNGDTSVVLTKDGQDWFQTQPVRFPLSQWSVQRIIESVAGLRFSQRLAPGTPGQDGSPTLEDVSLASPKAQITLRWGTDESQQRTIMLGRKAVGGRGYIKIGDEDKHFYVVNDAVHRYLLEEKPDQWRKKTIDAPTQGQASKVFLIRPDQTIDLIKTDGDWGFGSPHSGRVDADAVQSLLTALGSLSIDEFVADQPANLAIYGLDKPSTVLKISVPATTLSDQSLPEATGSDQATGESGSSDPLKAEGTQDSDHPRSDPSVLTVTIGSSVDLKKEAVFATWTQGDQPIQVVFTVAQSEVDKWDRSVADFRDSRVTLVKGDDVRELNIERPHHDPIKLLRGANGWLFADPSPGYEADDGAVSDLVDSITGWQAVSFEPDYVTPNQAQATIQLTAIGQAPDVVRVYPREGGEGFFAVRNNEAVGYVVPTEAVHSAFVPRILLRQRTVLDLSAESVNRITIERPDGTQYRFERAVEPEANSIESTNSSTATATTQAANQFEAWGLVGHDRFEVAAFNRLKALLFPLRANSWVVEDDPPSSAAAVTNPVDLYNVVLTTTDGREHTVRVDFDGAKAVLGDQSEWFEVGVDFLNLLDSEFRYRTVLPLKPEAIRAVTIQAGDKSMTIERGEGSQYEESSGRLLDQAATARLFDTLAGLRVQRFVEPLHLPTDAATTIEVTADDGQSYRLVLGHRPGHEQTATLGSQWFILNQETLEHLRAPLEADNDGQE